jgi:hypothetical protein
MKIFLKYFFALGFLFFSVNSFSQEQSKFDSVEVRIYNLGKHYLKKYVITIAGRDYTFTDIWKKKYSEYQKLPYLWSLNKSEATVIINRMIKYDRWMTSRSIPIDYIGEQKYLHGKYCIEVKCKRKGDRLIITETVIKESNSN